MPSDNVERTHRLADALAKRDLEGLLALTDPQVEWWSFLGQLGEEGVYRGHEGVRQYVADLGDARDVFSVEIRDSIAAGQVVLAVGCLRYRGKGSGVEAESPAGYVIKFRSGKVVRLKALRDPERAFEMVGETG